MEGLLCSFFTGHISDTCKGIILDILKVENDYLLILKAAGEFTCSSSLCLISFTVKSSLIMLK